MTEQDMVKQAMINKSEDIASSRLKVAVLVSGSGSNLQVLIDAMQAGELPIDIVGVISNNDEAYAIERAQKAGIKTTVLSHITKEQALKPESIGKRMGIKTFERHTLTQLNAWQPDLIVLAGFMRILNPEFIDAVPAPMINLHPSLLPKYKGLDTHQRALDAKDRYHGCSIHVVTAELDAGQVLTQALLEVEVIDNVNNNVAQTAEALQKRVQKLEHQLLPWTVLLIAQNVLDLSEIEQQVDTNGTSHTQSKTHLPMLPLRLLIQTAEL